MSIGRHFYIFTIGAFFLILSLLFIGGWSSPPKQNYQYFRFSSMCTSGLTIDIFQYTANYYWQSWPSGINLIGRSPTDQDIKLVPTSSSARQAMRKYNLLAYYIVVKRNGQVCYTLKLTQRDLDLLNAEFERQQPNNPDYIAIIQIKGGCCT